MGIRKASASAMVVKLEARGLVKRIPCQFDARAQHILLSEDGKQFLEVGEGVYHEAAQRLQSGPLADEVAALEAALANVHDAE